MWVLGAVLSAVSDSSVEDRAVSDRMARGDQDALGEIYDRHGRLVYSLAFRIVRDQVDAEDVVQEVFSQAWRQASRYDPSRGSVLGWLLTLTRSRAIDRLRGRRARPEPSTDERLLNTVPDPAAPADVQVAASVQATQIRSAMEDLSVLQRVAIELAFFEGLTHAESLSASNCRLGR